MIDEKAVTRGAPGIKAPLRRAQELSDILKPSLKLHHTGILECIPSHAIKRYSAAVQM